MASSIKWGILATGGIAHQFARGLKESKTGELVAVGSRTIESASKFAEQHGGVPYASYMDVLSDQSVQAIYIATPHHLHYDWTVYCAEAGKGILCEKPFTLNALEAERALTVVKANDVFFMEAFMYRCSAQIAKAKELLDDGAIGELLAINSEFSFAAGKEWKNFRTDADLGGGGLMDVGVYPISLSRYLAASEPEVAFYAPKLSEGGYDEYGSGCLRMENGVTVHFGCGVHCNMSNGATLYGTTGSISITDPWKVSGSVLTLHQSGKAPESFQYSMSNDALYGLEADTVAEFFEAKQAPYVTWEDTIGNMKTLDALRASAGMKFGAEKTF
jgi:predicted dehydrogenase